MIDLHDSTKINLEGLITKKSGEPFSYEEFMAVLDEFILYLNENEYLFKGKEILNN